MDTLCLEAAVGQLLAQRRLTLALAESCTGGLVAHRITNVSGSSSYFIGGVVAYANGAKERTLGVPAEVLETHGAVSRQAAQAMAHGARVQLGADIGLAVTGIAGPDGGAPHKPVGLVYLHLATRDHDWAEMHVWAGTRHQNKAQSAEAALLLLWRWLQRGPANAAVPPPPRAAGA